MWNSLADPVFPVFFFFGRGGEALTAPARGPQIIENMTDIDIDIFDAEENTFLMHESYFYLHRSSMRDDGDDLGFRAPQQSCYMAPMIFNA